MCFVRLKKIADRFEHVTRIPCSKKDFPASQFNFVWRGISELPSNFAFRYAVPAFTFLANGSSVEELFYVAAVYVAQSIRIWTDHMTLQTVCIRRATDVLRWKRDYLSGLFLPGLRESFAAQHGLDRSWNGSQTMYMCVDRISSISCRVSAASRSKQAKIKVSQCVAVLPCTWIRTFTLISRVYGFIKSRSQQAAAVN
jgi:hypothetical protein